MTEREILDTMPEDSSIDEILTQAAVDDAEVDSILQEFQLSEESAQPEQATPEIPTAVPPKKKKGVSALSVVLIICSLLVVATAVSVGIVYRQWSQRFEAAQPEQKSVEVFSLLFKDPDWGLLYTMAGMEDSAFEDRDTFVSYISQIVKGEPLYYMEVSSDSDFLRNYIVVCKDTILGTFSMKNSGGAIPNWQLSKVTLHRVGSRKYVIRRHPEHTVYINGIPLDDSYIIRSTSTLAEDFLPDHLHGERMQEMLITGLMLEPEIVVVDENGATVDMYLEEETGIFAPLEQAGPQIADEHEQFALNAAKASAAFAVRANSFTELRQFFDPNSNAYQVVQNTPALIEGCASYSFDPTVTKVTNYRSYGTDAFSVTVSLKLDATQENGDAQSFDFTWHYLLTQNYTGNYMITEVSEESFHTQRQQVRITTVYDGEVLSSDLVDETTASIPLPQILAPEGMVFVGWAREITDASGNVTMGILFPPTADGTAALPEGTLWEPMTLYAMFQPQE